MKFEFDPTFQLQSLIRVLLRQQESFLRMIINLLFDSLNGVTILLLSLNVKLLFLDQCGAKFKCFHALKFKLGKDSLVFIVPVLSAYLDGKVFILDAALLCQFDRFS